MNKKIWKLQIIGERLWILANLTAQHAAALKMEEGRGLAVVADETHLKLRGMEIPLIDGCKLLDRPKTESAFVILQTPWAEFNKTYAVTADVLCIICCPIGKAVDAPANMPLAKYVRECWESENDEPFYFMDWIKMLEAK